MYEVKFQYNAAARKWYLFNINYRESGLGIAYNIAIDTGRNNNKVVTQKNQINEKAILLSKNVSACYSCNNCTKQLWTAIFHSDLRHHIQQRPPGQQRMQWCLY